MHAVEVQLQLMTAKVTCMIAFTCTYTVVGVGDSSNIWAKCWSAFIWVKLSPVVCLSYLWIFQAPIAGSNKWRSGKATIYTVVYGTQIHVCFCVHFKKAWCVWCLSTDYILHHVCCHFGGISASILSRAQTPLTSRHFPGKWLSLYENSTVHLYSQLSPVLQSFNYPGSLGEFRLLRACSPTLASHAIAHRPWDLSLEWTVSWITVSTLSSNTKEF